MLATVAHENGVPVYSVAPTSTVDLSLAEAMRSYRGAGFRAR